MQNSSIEKLEELAANVATREGFSLFGIRLLSHTKPITLELQISYHSERDVTLSDCERFSKIFGDALEATSLLPEPYVLEISSPGIGEHLSTDRDFNTFKGFPVEVTLSSDGQLDHRLVGLLHKRTEEMLQINIRGRIKRIARNDVIKVKLTSSEI